MNKILTESREIRLKRLRFRSWHRGCKETDLLLGHFADKQLATLEGPLLAAYEALLDEDDAHIWDWLTGKCPPTREDYTPLLALLRECRPDA